jgi:RNA binding exosome subunit
MKVNSISLTVFAHETEDEGKIDSAVRSFFSSFLTDLDSSFQKVYGHFDDKLVIMKYSWEGKSAKQVLRYLLTSLSPSDRLILKGSIHDHVDGSKLHIRLDKQAMIANGRPKLTQGDDVIKVIISFSNFNFGELEELIVGTD